MVLPRALVAAVIALATVRSTAPQVFRDPRMLKSGVDLVMVTATVVDAEGHLTSGLPREAFSVWEDGIEQTVSTFTNERVPVGLGVLLDVSDSMFGQRIADARAAVERFLLDLLAPEDAAFVMTFNHAPHLLTTWITPAEAATVRTA